MATGPAAALRRATLLRMAHGWASLGRIVQVEIVVGAIGLPALLADYSQRFYTAGSDREALVPWIVRVVVLLTLLLGILLARVSRSLFLVASDEPFLAAAPLAPARRLRYRSFQLALCVVPALWLGSGAIWPLAWNGDPGLLARGLALWLAACALAWAWTSLAALVTPRPGRGQGAFELVAGVVPALVVWGMRPLSGLVSDLDHRGSLWVTAALCAAAAAALAGLAPRARPLLVRWERTLEWVRVHGSKRRRGRSAAGPPGGASGDPAAGARWPRFGAGASALVARNLRLALRTPRVGGPWAGAILLKALGFLLVAVPPPGGAPEQAPWALAGALLVLGDSILGGALVAHMGYEHPHVFFGAPLAHRRQWWGLAGPALVLSGACSLALSLAAAFAHEGGLETARFILAWCGLAGMSLLVIATNLSLASFPDVDVAQNLYWVGLLVCFVLSAAIPLFGWVVLVAFALYSFRQLRHWGPA